MTKELWVDIRPWKKELVTAAIESGADAVMVEQADRVRELGRITTVAPDGDLVPGRDVHEVVIRDKQTEMEAVEMARNGPVIVSTSDWTVIPLENLVAQSDRILVRVRNREEAEVALTVLERGVRGVVLQAETPAEIRDVARLIKKGTEQVSLVALRVTSVHSVGMGDRVCVDTCSILDAGQGLLVGDTSSGYLLVHAETLQNPYVAPRPFRVNAGAAHAYTILPDGKTGYLSELSSGDRVLVVDAAGNGAEAVVGRVKIERRPLLRIEAEGDGVRASLIVQNAETIRLVRPDGAAVSVVEILPGDEVLGHITTSGRHFGMAVQESIIEK